MLSNWRMRASGRPSAVLQNSYFAMLLDVFQLTCRQSCAGLWERFLRPNAVPNRGKMNPKWLPGRLLEHLGLLEASWNALGGLMERSWRPPRPKQSARERLLAGPRRFPRQVSAILGANRHPKGRPRESQIESKRRLELKREFFKKHRFSI